MKTAKPRLSPETWILAGFKALIARGPSALKAEPLARDLKTTKGSFYWHFKDVPDFQTQMLEYWEAKAFSDITTHLNSITDPAERLFKLGEISVTPVPENGGDNGEPAIRAWGQSNGEVAAAIARIDTQRMSYLGTILTELGLTDPRHSRIIYAAYIGFGTLSAADGESNQTAMATLIDAVLNTQKHQNVAP